MKVAKNAPKFPIKDRKKLVILLPSNGSLSQLEMALSNAKHNHFAITIITPDELSHQTEQIALRLYRKAEILSFGPFNKLPNLSEKACQAISDANVFQIIISGMEAIRHVENQFTFKIGEYYPWVRFAYTKGVREFEFFYSNAILSRRIEWTLDELSGVGKGKKCFVVGNGPSLNAIDIQKLRGQDVFCCNRIYLGFEDWGFHFPYWGIFDRIQIEHFITEWQTHIPKSVIKFFPFEYLPLLNLKNMCPVNFSYDERLLPGFSDSAEITHIGFSSVHTLMQLAATLGYKRIVLIGVDNRFDVEIINDRWKSVDSPNHFHPDYCDGGKREFVPPRFEKSNAAYEYASQWCNKNGVEVLNASVGSALNCFPFVLFESLF